MPDLASIAARDGWRCWLCDGPVPPDARRSDPNAPTLDHVVPRSKGGRTTDGNLRLAHRRCNAARRSGAPQLPWPPHLAVVDAGPLWPALVRLHRRGGSEIVALTPADERADDAARWVAARAGRLLDGHWTAVVEPRGPLAAIRLAHRSSRS